jgi:hypothetical protein
MRQAIIRNYRGWLLAGLLCSGLQGERAVAAEPSLVKVVKNAEGFSLTRNGQPYFIKGVGGDGSLKALAAAGGNSVRTWGAERLGETLDEAQKHGLTVTAGIWLGHERHGFSYNNADMVAKQYEETKKTIARYKDHPALLMWALGNEMEGYDKGDNAAIWSAINNLAHMTKSIDPNHPTMTVLAEIGGDKVKNVHRLCPEIDVLGINSYGGASTLPRRYQAAGGTKPFVLTEFGPPGQWESSKTAWGAAPELSSTDKAEIYARVYREAVLGARGTCLGSYAFVWGHKQEATATWFGLLLPDGHRTAAVDALSELWTGKPPVNRCPRIKSLKLAGPDQVAIESTVYASLVCDDPDKDPITVRWVVQAEGTYGAGGDSEAVPPTFPEALLRSNATAADVKFPRAGGYRVFAYVSDAHGGAAVANIPIFVKRPPPRAGAAKAELPFVLYDETGRKPTFVPSGYMGNHPAIKIDENCHETPLSGKSCLRMEYRDRKDWGGVVWQNPANDWGDQPGGFDLSGAKRLSFWARGEQGGEVVSFEFGLIGRDKKYFDSDRGKLENVRLESNWKQYSIDLSGKNLLCIKTGFCCVVTAKDKSITFYLDDIRYE